jgi:hypothetical protein
LQFEGTRSLTTKPVVKLGGVLMAARAPWEVSDELWELVEPLIPRKEWQRAGVSPIVGIFED